MYKSSIRALLGVCCLILFGTGNAYAWHLEGRVLCDVNVNGYIDINDLPMPDVGVNIIGSISGASYGTTNSDGRYYISLSDNPDTYTANLNMATLPADATMVDPVSGQHDFALTSSVVWLTRNWLINSEICQQQVNKCWLTGGGVKFSNITGSNLAEKGPRESLGGNVFPSCDPAPGNGGQWNHISHANKLHFLGKSINTVACGNVPGIEPGSESPVTPYNYIEFQGTGSLNGIKGNKVKYENVYFFARAEDRNEPGSNGAKDGADIDRYFIRVFSDLSDPAGSTLLLVEDEETPAIGDPITITGGNLQLHISSCDNPPAL